eukprot:TRINITY_DN2780_c0_g1_i1.p1 TRINITY_DN2780_c0_g1~~TRINITY_DN2780_c0_g1_i1.p1  ORF type:complete len:1250 (-),score=144.01 TRINITY_DN2780_c0_g1_i1:13-3762(-)
MGSALSTEAPTAEVTELMWAVVSRPWDFTQQVSTLASLRALCELRPLERDRFDAQLCLPMAVPTDKNSPGNESGKPVTTMSNTSAFLTAVYKLANNLGALTQPQREEYVRFLDWLTSTGDHALYVSTGIGQCLHQVLSFALKLATALPPPPAGPSGVSFREEQAPMELLPVPSVLRIIARFVTDERFVDEFVRLGGHTTLARILSDQQQPAGARQAAVLALHMCQRWKDFGVKLDVGHVSVLRLLVQAQPSILIGALQFIITALERSGPQTTGNRDALVNGGIVQDLLQVLTIQARVLQGFLPPTTSPDPLSADELGESSPVKCIAGILAVLDLLMVSAAVLEHVFAAVDTIVLCILVVHYAHHPNEDGEIVPLCIEAWNNDPTQRQLVLGATRILMKFSFLVSYHEGLLQSGAVEALMLTATPFPDKDIDPLGTVISATCAKALRALTQKDMECKLTVLQEESLTALVQSMRVEAPEATLHTLNLLHALVPSKVDEEEQAELVESFTAAIQFEALHSTCIIVREVCLNGVHDPLVLAVVRAAVDLLTVLSRSFPRLRMFIGGLLPFNEFASLLDLVNDRELRAKSVVLVTLLATESTVLGALTAAGLRSAAQRYYDAMVPSASGALYKPSMSLRALHEKERSFHLEQTPSVREVSYPRPATAPGSGTYAPMSSSAVLNPVAIKQGQSAAKIQRFFRQKLYQSPATCRKMRLLWYSNCLIEKLQLFEQAMQRTAAIYKTHIAYVAAIVSRKGDGTQAAEAIALWRHLNRQTQAADMDYLAVEIVAALEEKPRRPERLLPFFEQERKYWAAVAIQRCWRRYAKRQRDYLFAVQARVLIINTNAALAIQRVWRGAVCRSHLLRWGTAAVAIQRWWRLCIELRNQSEKDRAARTLQGNFRNYLRRKAERLIPRGPFSVAVQVCLPEPPTDAERRDAASRCLQRWTRSVLARRRAAQARRRRLEALVRAEGEQLLELCHSLIKEEAGAWEDLKRGHAQGRRNVTRRLAENKVREFERQQLHRQCSAATKIQRVFRGHRDRVLVVKMSRAVLLLQRLWRGYYVRRHTIKFARESKLRKSEAGSALAALLPSPVRTLAPVQRSMPKQAIDSVIRAPAVPVRPPFVPHLDKDGSPLLLSQIEPQWLHDLSMELPTSLHFIPAGSKTPSSVTRTPSTGTLATDRTPPPRTPEDLPSTPASPLLPLSYLRPNSSPFGTGLRKGSGGIRRTKSAQSGSRTRKPLRLPPLPSLVASNEPL